VLITYTVVLRNILLTHADKGTTDTKQVQKQKLKRENYRLVMEIICAIDLVVFMFQRSADDDYVRVRFYRYPSRYHIRVIKVIISGLSPLPFTYIFYNVAALYIVLFGFMFIHLTNIMYFW